MGVAAERTQWPLTNREGNLAFESNLRAERTNNTLHTGPQVGSCKVVMVYCKSWFKRLYCKQIGAQTKRKVSSP